MCSTSSNLNALLVVGGALALSSSACHREPSLAQAPVVAVAAPVATPPLIPACRDSGEGVSVLADRLLSAPIAFDLYTGTVAPESLVIVDAVAHRLRECADVRLEVQVHTDAFRMSAFNARQSQRVAEALRDRLVASGVEASRLVPCGYGESQPITSAPGIQAHPVNARVEWHRLSTSAAAFTCPPVPD